MNLPAIVDAARDDGAAGPACARANAACCGAAAGNLTTAMTGISSLKARLVIVTLPGFSPSLFARTVIGPGARVARTATRLMPASRSRNALFTELILPL